MYRATHLASTLRVGVAVALLAAALTAGPSASAAKQDKVFFPVDISYPLNDLSEVCGFAVEFSMVGTFKGTLFKDRSGTIVGEFDSQPNTTITFSAPDNERSFSYKFSTTFHNRYPEGVDPGDRVITSATGFVEKLPGLPASAGRAYFPDGEVVAFIDGIPYSNYGEPTIEHGHESYSGEDADAAICAALAG